MNRQKMYPAAWLTLNFRAAYVFWEVVLQSRTVSNTGQCHCHAIPKGKKRAVGRRTWWEVLCCYHGFFQGVWEDPLNLGKEVQIGHSRYSQTQADANWALVGR